MILETLPDLTAEDFALMWSAEFEDHCESQHSDPMNQVCTHVVVARASYDCEPTIIKVCNAAAAYYISCIFDPDAECFDCDRPCSECWHILPL